MVTSSMPLVYQSPVRQPPVFAPSTLARKTLARTPLARSPLVRTPLARTTLAEGSTWRGATWASKGLLGPPRRAHLLAAKTRAEVGERPEGEVGARPDLDLPPEALWCGRRHGFPATAKTSLVGGG